VPAETQTALVAGVRQCFVDQSRQKDNGSLPASCVALQANAPSSAGDKRVGDAVVRAVKAANGNNFTTAFKTGMVVALIAFAIVLLLSFGLPRHFKSDPAAVTH
jgi:hypothetical protein